MKEQNVVLNFKKKKKELKDLCFTGAHVADLTSENVITQGSQQGEFVVQFLICLFVQCEISYRNSLTLWEMHLFTVAGFVFA